MRSSDPQKILIIRLSSIGDILLATPLLRALRRRFPDARIDCLVKKQFQDLLRTNRHLSELLLFDTKKPDELKRMRRLIRTTGYQLILDIHKNPRSLCLSAFLPHVHVRRLRKYYVKRFLLVHFHCNLYRQTMPVYRRYLATAADWGILDDGYGLEFFIDPAAANSIGERVAAFAGDRRLVGLAPSATFANKRWPWDFYAIVANQLQSDGRTGIALLGDRRDRVITGRIADALPQPPLHVAGELSLMESAAVISRLQLLITNDTGLMHLSTALRVPTVAIFGPTTRELGFYPEADFVHVIEHPDLKCRPCTHMGLDHCPQKHFRCMREILPDRVLAAAASLLEKNHR